MSLREFLITAGVACCMIWFVCWCIKPALPTDINVHHIVEIKNPYELAGALKHALNR